MNHRDAEAQRVAKGSEPGPLADLTEAVIGAAMEVHCALGPGLLASAYEAALCRELGLRGIRFQRQLKAVDKIIDIHDAQLLAYLRLTGKGVGLIINFKVALLKNGIHRRVL